MAYIGNLNIASPADTDNASAGASKIRELKIDLDASFPNVTAPVTLTHTQLNNAVNLVAGIDMLFYEASCPTGWGAVAQNDKALRVVTNGTTGGSAGGANAFSTVMTPTRLSASATADLVSHIHGLGGHIHGLESWSQPISGSGAYGDPNTHVLHEITGDFVSSSTYAWRTLDTTTESIGHVRVAAASGNTDSAGSGGGHAHQLNLDIQYADIIICTKS